ncbi:MAG: GntR family transcriptional regulator [Deltaproteobacteria bacterium]|jgi:DNA-binding GntR family transcriptional regulator|nr:GntR family transcriptional regulator [Deltaproteobacteria bacterium]MBW2469426.1 GntR family transcriptional regulator [Deltaproteobacteria bacterium]MBW2518671.1 GntR family transcriptional regulator [Deltaproteobacteria bacterium]
MRIESLVDLAKRHIQLWIIKGEYRPGQRLKEEEISARLDISRPPVREAFKFLEAEGLVMRKPRRGVFVSEMTAKDVWEAYTLKATLYEMATELALDNISDPQIAELESFVEKMEECAFAAPVNLLGYQEHHQEFHNRILLISGNERLKKISASIHLQVCRFSYKSLQDEAHLNASIRYHRRILDALKKKNKSLACKLMKDHVLEALDVLLDMYDRNEATSDKQAIKSAVSE